jgi:hypothetical protein
MEERVFSDTTGNPASEPATDEARVLAELPPTSWPRTRQRFAALADYLRIASPTAEDVRRHASRLGVSPVTFQRVIAAHRALQTGREPKRSRRGLHRSLPPATAAIVEDVIAELGPNATDAAVHREAERRAIAKGLPVASPNAIRTRRGRGPQSVDLRSRLQLDFDAILDCCPLTFDVVDGSGEQRPAVLAALIAGADGEICGISLHAGFPSGTELVALAQRARTLARLRDVEAPVLVATWTARRELNGHRTALVDAGYVLGDASSVRLRGGSAITPVLGRSVGRAPFAMFRRPDGPKSDVVLPIDLARRVLAYGVDCPIDGVPDGVEPDAIGKAHGADEALAHLRRSVETVLAGVAGADATAAREAAEALCASLGAFVTATVDARLTPDRSASA